MKNVQKDKNGYGGENMGLFKCNADGKIVNAYKRVNTSENEGFIRRELSGLKIPDQAIKDIMQHMKYEDHVVIISDDQNAFWFIMSDDQFVTDFESYRE